MDFFGLTVYFLIPFSSAYFFSVLILRYYSFYGIGVNNGANSGWQLLIVYPVFALYLCGLAFGSMKFTRRLKLRKIFQSLITIFFVVLVGFLTFLFQVSRSANYPTEKKQRLTDFLNISNILDFDFPNSNSNQTL